MNIDECFNCTPESVMDREYISDFSFIKEKMDYRELLVILMELEDIGKRNNSLSPKANYLLGNFFYNISLLGYYRNISRFNTGNYNNYKYHIFNKPDIYDGIYFKNYHTYYINSYRPSKKYFESAYHQTTNREFKARILFALSKSEQGEYIDEIYDNINSNMWNDNRRSEYIYFKELMKYQDTKYFREVESRCKYFEYYVNNR